MPRYIAIVKNVKEVALAALADLDFWRRQLSHTGLFPYNRDSRAELLLSATSFIYQGRPTNEFVVSMTVSKQPDGSTLDGAFLLHAFNSSRLFAWIERTFYRTPYYPGSVRLENTAPVGFVISDHHGSLVQAQMVELVQPAAIDDQLWEGRIFLPEIGKLKTKFLEFFNARLGGQTEIYPYQHSQNVFQIRPRSDYPFIKWLLDSGVTPVEWRVRKSAEHSRSRTYQWKGD